MRAALQQFVFTLRLQLRNRMGMIYGYLFPTIFLIAFWVLYRWEPVPIIRHLGELLTVTALGGACFGLPTAMVSERERGVWRRYRLAPISAGSLVGSTVAARYLLLLSAALLQIVLAMLLGMPLPDHPLHLWVAFTFVSFAFLGLGLVIAMLADNVPAVQALGQSIFLPMLIIGGVAVRLESLPEWAQHLSAFFPGRWAVEAIQATATGGGLGEAGFALLALTLTGVAGCVAAAMTFRWDARERFVSRQGKGWVAVAVGAWVLVGVMAEATGQAVVRGGGPAMTLPPTVLAPADDLPGSAGGSPQGSSPSPTEDGAVAAVDTMRADPPVQEEADAAEAELDTPTTGEAGAEPQAATAPTGEAGDRVKSSAGVGSDPPADPASGSDNAAPSAEPPADEPVWASVTIEEIGRRLRFDQLPHDGGVVTPVAPESTEPDRFVAEQLDCMRQWLPAWEPAQVEDPVQRARNVLDVAAAADLYQMDAIESLVPHIVFDHLRAEFPRDELTKILFWIAVTPDEGDPPAVDQLSLVCLDAYGEVNLEELRVRNSIYAAKLLGRMIGFILPR